ncbi:MAG: hypothetical protein U5N85_22710 [Arcicella sp.]|nr:hypothetical protein [Arcicella sp.]
MKKLITPIALVILTTGFCLANKPNKLKSNNLKKKVETTINTNSCGYITSVCTSTICKVITPPPPETCVAPYPPLPEMIDPPTPIGGGPGRG